MTTFKFILSKQTILYDPSKNTLYCILEFQNIAESNVLTLGSLLFGLVI